MSFLKAFVLLLVALVPLRAGAALLGSFTDDVGLDSFNGATSTAFVGLCFSESAPEPPTNCPTDPNRVELFTDLVVSSADAGSTFVATSASDPDFAAVAEWLTNGVNDEFSLFFGPVGGTSTGSSAGTSKTEALWFFGDSSGASGIDFAGYTIDAIHLTLSGDFTVVPNPALDRTVTTGSAFVEVFGTVVPEPSTALLVGSGLLGLLSRRVGSWPRWRISSSSGTRRSLSHTFGPRSKGQVS